MLGCLERSWIVATESSVESGAKAAFAFSLVLGVGLIALAPAAEAEVMIRYDHPVFHNGHRVLYHGAWRTRGGGGHARAKSDDSDEEEDPKPAKPAAATVPSSNHEFIVLVDTDDATGLRMATELVGAAKSAGLHARAWAGKTSPSALAKFVAADGGDFAVAAIDTIASDPKTADLRAKSPLVARLANEPLVVIAGAAITDISQLSGRPVAFGEADGLTDATGQALFKRLGVQAKVVNLPLQAGLAQLAAGKVDAIVTMSADESKAVSDASKSEKLHAVPIPWRAELAGHYAPARMNARDLPHLVGTDDTLDTVGVPFGLIAIDAADGSTRAAQDAPFVAALFERYGQLLGAGDDPKWRDVNLAAETDWPRLQPAREWIAKHPAKGDASLEAFRETAHSFDGAQGGTTPAMADKLYGNLLRSEATQP